MGARPELHTDRHLRAYHYSFMDAPKATRLLPFKLNTLFHAGDASSLVWVSFAGAVGTCASKFVLLFLLLDCVHHGPPGIFHDHLVLHLRLHSLLCFQHSVLRFDLPMVCGDAWLGGHSPIPWRSFNHHESSRHLDLLNGPNLASRVLRDLVLQLDDVGSDALAQVLHHRQSLDLRP